MADTGSSSVLSVGVSSEQGRRPTMEDAEIIMINLKEQFPDHAPEKSSFFGVFDGHGGRRAADFVAVQQKTKTKSNIIYYYHHKSTFFYFVSTIIYYVLF